MIEERIQLLFSFTHLHSLSSSLHRLEIVLTGAYVLVFPALGTHMIECLLDHLRTGSDLLIVCVPLSLYAILGRFHT